MEIHAAALVHSESARYDGAVRRLAGTEERYDREALQRAAEEFEAFFLQQMLSVMRRTVPEGGFLKKDHAHEIFEGMLDEALAGEMARAGGIGLANLLVAQLSAKLSVY